MAATKLIFRLKYLFSVLFLLCCTSSFSMDAITETEKTSSLFKVWGFLKYYHPAVARGSMDWDQVFIAEVDTLTHINTKEELNKHYLRWITALGDVKQYPARSLEYDTACNHNVSLDWIDNNELFIPELSAILKDIIVHRAVKSRFVHPQSDAVRAAAFTNEDPYPAMVCPSKAYRLLAIARYWNMIEYFFPYKHLMDAPWSNTLDTCIPLFEEARDTLGYISALNKLIAGVNDTHANLYFHKGINLHKYILPIVVKVFPDKAIVTEVLNDSIARTEDIKPGDILLYINDTSISDWIRYKAPWMGASNQSVIRRNLRINLTAGSTRNVTLYYDRDGVRYSKTVHRFAIEKLNYKPRPLRVGLSYKLINDSIGYVNMGLLKPKEVKKSIKALAGTKAIIFDQRNYPNLTFRPLGNYLAARKTVFANCISPNFSFPGKFVCEKPLSFGHKKQAPYKGKIIILVNEETQSQGEFTTMVLSALPNSTVIGTQTAGADGNAVDIVLPGDFKLIMSGLDFYYPDGRQAQRTGARINIYADATIEGIRQHKDEILARAIIYADTGM